MIPTVGRIVHYRLSEVDATNVASSRARSSTHGNTAREGDVFPMVIVRTWGDTEGAAVNGRVLLDGPDDLWVTSRNEGTGPGTWSPPPRI